MLGSLQTEWDAVMIDVYTLRNHLEKCRKELAHSLYQHDAAMRVVARLVKEKEQMQSVLELTNQELEKAKIDSNKLQSKLQGEEFKQEDSAGTSSDHGGNLRKKQPLKGSPDGDRESDKDQIQEKKKSEGNAGNDSPKVHSEDGDKIN